MKINLNFSPFRWRFLLLHSSWTSWLVWPNYSCKFYLCPSLYWFDVDWFKNSTTCDETICLLGLLQTTFIRHFCLLIIKQSFHMKSSSKPAHLYSIFQFLKYLVELPNSYVCLENWSCFSMWKCMHPETCWANSANCLVSWSSH